MRIVAGIRRGLVIKSIEGESTRPTRDIVREALFNILMNRIYDARFLDLFAGSGAIGIEALSRGAKEAYFSDINPKCTRVINENITKAKFNEQSKVYTADYKLVLKKLQGSVFDIVYIDPPYNKGMGIDAIELIAKYNLLSDDGIIILETDTNEEVPTEIGEFEVYDNKRYGRNILNLIRRKG